MIDCSSPACKLVSMFSAHSEDKSVPHELQFFAYPDDEQFGSIAHGGTGVNLDVFADSFTLAEARELDAMAGTFSAHCAELLAAPPWGAWRREHALRLAHVRAPGCSPVLLLSACPSGFIRNGPRGRIRRHSAGQDQTPSRPLGRPARLGWMPLGRPARLGWMPLGRLGMVDAGGAQ